MCEYVFWRLMCVCVRMYKWGMCEYVCFGVSACVHLFVEMCVCVCVLVYVCVVGGVCMYVIMYACIDMY